MDRPERLGHLSSSTLTSKFKKNKKIKLLIRRTDVLRPQSYLSFYLFIYFLCPDQTLSNWLSWRHWGNVYSWAVKMVKQKTPEQSVELKICCVFTEVFEPEPVTEPVPEPEPEPEPEPVVVVERLTRSRGKTPVTTRTRSSQHQKVRRCF